MPRKVTPRTSRGAEPDEQPPKHDLRTRAAHRMVSDGKNLGDARRQSLARRTKRAPTDTRAQSSTSRGIVKRKTKASSVQGRAKRNKNKLWLAEAIREESNTHYLIEYKPVSEGAQREISWQPKRNANAALVKDWEELQMATTHGNSNAASDKNLRLTLGGDEASQRCSSMRHDEHLGQSTTDNRDEVDRGVVSSKFEPKSSKLASPIGNKLEMSASYQLLRIADDENSAHALIAHDTEATDPSPVVVSTACVSRTRVDPMSAQPPSGLQTNNHSGAESLEQVTEGYVTSMGSHGSHSPRPGTSISTILSQAPSTLSKINRDNESATSDGQNSVQASPRTLAHVEVSKNRDPGVSGAVSGKLASAREQLRLLLRGPGRRRFRKSSLRFPPSP